MKKAILFLIVVSFLLNACSKKEGNFISNVIEKTNEKQSVHYKISQKYFYSNGLDTAYTPCEVWAVRDNSDILRNGYVWVDDYYRPYNMIYDKGNFYLAIPPKKVTALYPDFTGSLISEVDWIDIFLKPEILQTQFTDPLNTTSMSDTTYNGEECKKICVEFPAGKKEEKKSYIYILSKEYFMPLFAVFKTENKEYTLYDELSFSDYEFDNVNREELRERQEKVFAENPIEDRDAGSETSKLENMLHIGDDAPVFEGEFYGGNNKFVLSEYIGKNVIIVDFWYTHCPPCVQAIPSLIELYNENKDAGLKIFGLNSVDNQSHSLAYLDKFLLKREISYDIIMTKPSVDLRYKIKGYPTLYIIDKEGKIAFVEIGFDKEKFEKLKEKVAELLQNNN